MSQEQTPIDQPIAPQVQDTGGGLIAPGPDITETPKPDIHLTNPMEAFAALDKTVDQGATPQIVNAGMVEALNHDPDSPKLTPVQRDLITSDRPGFTLPDGATQKTANYLSERYDKAQNLNKILSAGNPDLEGRMSQVTGGIMGSLLDPIDDGAAVLAPEFAGIAKAETLTGLAARSINRASRGAIEGAAYGTTQNAAQITNDEAVGDPDSWNGMHVLTNVMATTALGGTIAPIGGLIGDKLTERFGQDAADKIEDTVNNYKPFGQETSDLANQSAVAQQTAGKDVSLDPLLQQGAAAQESQFGKDIEATGIPKDDVVNAINSSQSDLADEMMKSNTRTNIELLRSKLKTVIPDIGELNPTLAADIGDIPKTTPHDLDAMESEIGGLQEKQANSGLTDEEQQHLDSTQENLRNIRSQLSKLDNVKTDDVADPVVKQALNDTDTLENNFNAKANDTELSDQEFQQHIADTESKLSDIQKSVDDDHQNIIRNMPDHEVLMNPALKQAVSHNNVLREAMRSHDLAREALENPTQPIDHSQFNEAAKQSGTHTGDFLGKDAPGTIEVNEGPDSPSTLFNDKFPPERQKSLLADRELLPAEKKEAEDIDALDQKNKTLKKAIKAAVSCITGGAGG